MSEVEVSARARKAVGRSSKFAAREVQLVVKIPWRILGQEKECVVHVQAATRDGEGSRVVICERKESPAHFGIALLPKKGVAKSVRAFDIFCTSVRGQLIQMEKQRCEMRGTMTRLSKQMGSFEDGL